MREPLDIIILKDGLRLCHPTDPSQCVFVDREERGVGLKIVECIERFGAAASTVNLFVCEDLLFFKAFDLPLETSDIAEAVDLQMEMLTPFADEPTWYSFSTLRTAEAYKVTLYAAQSGYIDVYIQEMIEAGFQLSGLFPESQRYVNRTNRKNQWGLLLPGRFFKAFVFNGLTLEDRLLCSAEPSFTEAVEVCRSDIVYRQPPRDEEDSPVAPLPGQTPYFEYLDARNLLRQRPALKAYNMLPASYQRPDYLKIAIMVLAVLNILTLAAFGGVKMYKLVKTERRIDREIAAVSPLVKEMKQLRLKEEDRLKAINQMRSLGSGLNLIDFLTRLTKTLPASSYVDQMRYDPKTGAVHVQGYTEDVAEMTASLQELGDAKLKSTSRRKNKTYFHVEIGVK